MRNSKIKDIFAMEILDSRGIPTIKTTVTLESGDRASCSVPSGASTGLYEAVELRDNDSERYLGKGVTKACENVNKIIKEELVGINAFRQEDIDKIMIDLDGTENKSRLGANAILSVSLAVVKAAAKNQGVPLYRYLGEEKTNTLPVPMCNVINGGAHASNNLDIQEFMIAPTEYSSFSEGLRKCAEVFQHLKAILKQKNLSVAVGDEGGFAPDLESDERAFELLNQALERADAKGIKYTIDAAASEWELKDGVYKMPKRGISLTREELAGYWKNLIQKYPIISIEDGANEDDWTGWQLLKKELDIQLVGDDLFVTNTKRLKKGLELSAANSILIKPNQIGTLTETIQAIQMAKMAGFSTVMSHRSGETEDTTIADLAVGLGTDQIKTGSLSRSERTAKYNRLLEIERELGQKGVYRGQSAFK
ncbi:MAG: phosphopyruvate hydratase [Bacillota bacterium]|jgi:enolase|nr:phosphopyruvate hydratase [Bacillota bacterium]HHU43719.1 phosphopyruvate hydratase [Clostridiales bacterium]